MAPDLFCITASLSASEPPGPAAWPGDGVHVCWLPDGIGKGSTTPFPVGWEIYPPLGVRVVSALADPELLEAAPLAVQLEPPAVRSSLLPVISTPVASFQNTLLIVYFTDPHRGVNSSAVALGSFLSPPLLVFP